MFRHTLIKILVVLTAAAASYLLLRPSVAPLLQPMDMDEIRELDDRLSPKRTRVYDRHDVALWKDRSYHTYQFVQRISGLHFVPIDRNEERPYVLRVSYPTTLFTTANRLDLRDVKDWTVLPDTVLVDDVYAPRRFDVLLEQNVGAGSYVVRSPKGGPSKPVFFDPRVVQVVQR